MEQIFWFFNQQVDFQIMHQHNIVLDTVFNKGLDQERRYFFHICIHVTSYFQLEIILISDFLHLRISGYALQFILQIYKIIL